MVKKLRHLAHRALSRMWVPHDRFGINGEVSNNSPCSFLVFSELGQKLPSPPLILMLTLRR
jgi:hypothetical protein